MLDPGQDAPARDAVANEAKQQIEGAGTLKNENVWGLRKLAYEIKRCNEADYRWFRFEAPTELLEQLDHNLKIADGVLRFRIFKVDADTPVMAPPATSAPGPGASRERPAEAPAAPAAEPAAPPSRRPRARRGERARGAGRDRRRRASRRGAGCGARARALRGGGPRGARRGRARRLRRVASFSRRFRLRGGESRRLRP